jgi:hypothetical protein
MIVRKIMKPLTNCAQSYLFALLFYVPHRVHPAPRLTERHDARIFNFDFSGQEWTDGKSSGGAKRVDPS